MRCPRRAAVERDDARLVDHFVGDHDVARRLHDLVAGVVDRRRQRADHAARDAAVVEAAVRVRIRGAAALGCRTYGGLPRLARFRHRRHAAVRRIDDQRRLVLRIAALEPMRRRRDGPADGAAGCRRAFSSSKSALSSSSCRANSASAPCTLPRSASCGAQLLVALHRHADHRRAGPDAGEIGVAPRRARHFVGRVVRRIGALLRVRRENQVAAASAVSQDRSSIRMLLPLRMGRRPNLAARTAQRNGELCCPTRTATPRSARYATRATPAASSPPESRPRA